MKRVIVKAYAKINICFDITGKDEENGMHFVDTVMQTIDLYDYVIVSKRKDKTCVVTVDDQKVEDTVAIKAANLFVETFSTNGANIRIIKNIPVGAGLGGSSADSAGVLRAMAMLYEIDFSALTPLASSLGSDVAFLLTGGLQRCTGYGEKTEKLPPLPPLCVLVATPNSGVETKEAYENYDKINKKPFNVRTEEIIQNIRDNKNNRLLSTNILFNVVSAMNPDVLAVQKFVNSDSIPLHTSMSGSGSSFFALYPDVEKAYAQKANAPSEISVGVYQFVNSY